MSKLCLDFFIYISLYILHVETVDFFGQTVLDWIFVHLFPKSGSQLDLLYRAFRRKLFFGVCDKNQPFWDRKMYLKGKGHCVYYLNLQLLLQLMDTFYRLLLKETILLFLSSIFHQLQWSEIPPSFSLGWCLETKTLQVVCVKPKEKK